MDTGKSQSRPDSNMATSGHTSAPPFISECEVLHESGPSSTDLFNECSKNPGHPTFIPVKEFTMEHLPTYCRTPRVMDAIRHCSERTVKVTVRFTSWNRPATFPNSNSPYPFTRFKGSTRKVRVGTGIIVAPIMAKQVIRGRDCPCGICKHSEKPAREYQVFIVKTATHVVFDDSEAEKSTFELFYDSEEDRDNVKCLYGVRACSRMDSIKALEQFFTAGEQIYSAWEQINAVWLEEEGDLERRSYRDRICIVCVSHETELELISNIITPPFPHQFQSQLKAAGHYSNPCLDKNIAIIISHPHGKSKHITVGKRMFYNYPSSFDETYSHGHSADIQWFRAVKSYTINNHLDGTKNEETVSRCGIRRGTLLLFSSASSPLFPTHDYQMFMTSCKRLNGPLFWVLKEDIDLLIPTKSSYLCRRKVGLMDRFSFPVGTRFQSSRFGKNAFLLPDNVVFFFHLPLCYRKTTNVDMFETYDTDTCPGSSGAPIIRKFGVNGIRYLVTHSGAMEDGTNRCSVKTYGGFDIE